MSARIKIHKFGGEKDPLTQLRRSGQVEYLTDYLSDMQAHTTIEETAYFDRDYLDEFATFYSIGTKGYGNQCRRLHFFSGDLITRHQLRLAAGSNEKVINYLQENYLGYTVLRPIPYSPFGRTVIRWYDDYTLKTTPRVIDPSREYECHIAGITLKVEGIAWQQQDQGVSACATIALWSALHSSAFGDQFAIPTTVDITKYAHRGSSSIYRVFPSKGLNLNQVCQAIKECNLAPVVCGGYLKYRNELGYDEIAFTKEAFLSLIACLIRSGYPVLIPCRFLGTRSKHIVCCIGFRETAPRKPEPGQVELQDSETEFIYVHDDNIGPSARFKVETNPENGSVILKRSPPKPRNRKPGKSDFNIRYGPLVPIEAIVSAVHNQMRTNPMRLNELGVELGKWICQNVDLPANKGGAKKEYVGVTISFRLMYLIRYLENELGKTLSENPKALSRARLSLCEKVPPMSLHIGVARFGWGSTPLFDVLYDTTDSDLNLSSFCCVIFHPDVFPYLKALYEQNVMEIGIPIKAYL